MKIVGRRKMPPITIKATGSLLKRGCEVNDALHTLPSGNTTYFPKGVYRYKTFEAANQHWETCMIKGIAKQNK